MVLVQEQSSLGSSPRPVGTQKCTCVLLPDGCIVRLICLLSHTSTFLFSSSSLSEISPLGLGCSRATFDATISHGVRGFACDCTGSSVGRTFSWRIDCFCGFGATLSYGRCSAVRKYVDSRAVRYCRLGDGDGSEPDPTWLARCNACLRGGLNDRRPGQRRDKGTAAA